MNKMVLIVIDGLSNHIGKKYMGYMKGLVEAGIACEGVLEASLPTISRPLYETIFTGITPIEHGITNNGIRRKSSGRSLFHVVEEAGGVTGAAAYHWVSELYMKTPFNSYDDTYQLEGKGPIHYGIYYEQDDYPDRRLFVDAKYLISLNHPDFLLIHPMNVDHAGHEYGGESKEYISKARTIDGILSSHIPYYLEEGYSVLITADHGMGQDGSHSGPDESERLVPLWFLGDKTVELPKVSTDIYDFVLETMEVE